MKTLPVLLAVIALAGCMQPRPSDFAATGTSRDLQPSSTQPGVTASGYAAIGIKKTF